MQNSIHKHEDDRRILIEWIADEEFRSAKVVIAKSDQAVGDHYHQQKDEAFLLLTGKAKRVIIGSEEETDVSPFRKWVVPKGVYHLFELEKGSILLGVASKKFDPNDEISKSQ